MLTKRWSNVGKLIKLKLVILENLDVCPTLARCCSANNTNPFLLAKKKWCWQKVGPMLFNQPNINNFKSEILNVGRMLTLRCKANTIKGVAFQISSNTCWCWPNVGPTLCTQRQPSANSTTVCQRWPNVVTNCSYQQIIKTVRYCFHYRKMPVEKVSRIENQFIQLSSFSTFGVIWK